MRFFDGVQVTKRTKDFVKKNIHMCQVEGKTRQISNRQTGGSTNKQSGREISEFTQKVDAYEETSAISLEHAQKEKLAIPRTQRGNTNVIYL